MGRGGGEGEERRGERRGGGSMVVEVRWYSTSKSL